MQRLPFDLQASLGDQRAAYIRAQRGQGTGPVLAILLWLLAALLWTAGQLPPAAPPGLAAPPPPVPLCKPRR